MQIEGIVGPRALLDGALAGMRQGRTGEIITADSHGRYAEAARRGRLFIAANQGAQAVSVALATAYTGICLSNPIGSNKNVELLAAGFALSVAPAAIASLHLIGGYSAVTQVVHTTPLVPIVTKLDGSAGAVAKADASATIVAPQYLMPLMGGFTAAALPSGPIAWVDIGGIFVLPPGAFICIGALTTVTGFGGFIWEETDI